MYERWKWNMNTRWIEIELNGQMDNSNEDKIHTTRRQNGDNEAMKWYLDDGWAIWIIWTWDAEVKEWIL